MDKIMFKQVVWPQNPESYTVSYDRETAYSQEGEEGEALERRDVFRRTITGSGVLSGESAFEQFEDLERLCADPEAGWLVHPLHDRVFAVLVKLEMTQEPRENFIAYSFKFLEELEKPDHSE